MKPRPVIASQLFTSNYIVCDCLAKVSGINKVFKNAKQPGNLVDCMLARRGISYNTFSQVCRTDFHGIKYDIFSHFVKKNFKKFQYHSNYAIKI